MMFVAVVFRASCWHRYGHCCEKTCKNKDADQLHTNCAADQRLCYHYIDRTIPPLPKSETLSLSSVALQPRPSLCLTLCSHNEAHAFNVRDAVFCYHSLYAQCMVAECCFWM